MVQVLPEGCFGCEKKRVNWCAFGIEEREDEDVCDVH